MERGRDSVLGRDQGQEVQGLWMGLEEVMPAMVIVKSFIPILYICLFLFFGSKRSYNYIIIYVFNDKNIIVCELLLVIFCGFY